MRRLVLLSSVVLVSGCEFFGWVPPDDIEPLFGSTTQDFTTASDETRDTGWDDEDREDRADASGSGGGGGGNSGGGNGGGGNNGSGNNGGNNGGPDDNDGDGGGGWTG